MDNKMMIAYMISKRDEKSYWNRVGVGFINKDGSINVKLESLPVSGELQLRFYESREDSPRSESPKAGAKSGKR